MDRKIKLLIYGFLCWLLPFLVSYAIYPLKGKPLFETIMTLTLTLICVIVSVMFLKDRKKDLLKQGILLGIVLLFMSVFIDLFMFMSGPMQMSFVNYMKDIGLTYFMFPVITIGMGYLLETNEK